MKREWTPGDVAMIELPSGGEQLAVLFGAGPGGNCWHTVTSAGGFRCLSVDAVTARPLVVIDPEDREQVERLLRLLPASWSLTHEDNLAEALVEMQAALLEYADPKPPKPDEPQGLGAVVEDEDGIKYVRVAECFDGWAIGADWRRIGGELNEDKQRGWGNITAVRVLSEGVQP